MHSELQAQRRGRTLLPFSLFPLVSKRLELANLSNVHNQQRWGKPQPTPKQMEEVKNTNLPKGEDSCPCTGLDSNYNGICYMHTMDYYSAIKAKLIQSQKNITMSKNCQTLKNAWCDCIHAVLGAANKSMVPGHGTVKASVAVRGKD